MVARRDFAVFLVLCLALGLLSSAWAGDKPRIEVFNELKTNKTGPTPRIRPAVFFKQKANQLVTFGGGTETMTPAGDLWVLDLKTNDWSLIKPENGDLKKITTGIGIYDDKNDRLLMMVWSIEGKLTMYWFDFAKNKWEPFAPVGDVPNMVVTAPIYDPKTDSMLVFGGSVWDNPDNTRFRVVFYNNTYSFSLKELKWKKLVTKGDSPPVRDKHSQVYDSKKGTLLVFGGIGTDKTGREILHGDVYELDIAKAEWKKIETKGITPEPRYTHTALYDPGAHRMLVFGGAGPLGKYFPEILTLDLETYTWSTVKTRTPITLQIANSGGIWDTNQKRALLFGGIQPGRMLMNTIWELTEK